jgi:hypothetical protein
VIVLQVEKLILDIKYLTKIDVPPYGKEGT